MSKLAFIKVFTDAQRGLQGNTSAVVLLDQQLSEKELQALASDFNQPATTFLWPTAEGAYAIRWFAPDAEIGLCGHGSAAALAFLYRFKKKQEVTVTFNGGVIRGQASATDFSFFIDPIEVISHTASVPRGLEEALGLKVLEYFQTNNKDIVLVESETALQNMKPDFSALAKLKPFGYAVTAPGDAVDFVSRTLVPKVQQLEDHATGSSHAALTPFWSERLRKDKLTALQLSQRGGYFICEMAMNKVRLSGDYEVYAEGNI